MKIVFDLDDTICRTENRDYVNSSEISAVVSKIHELRETLPGVKIVVHTSRGMASCKGDAQVAEIKNRPVIEKWLAEHGIHVDEIVFGKPLGDIYVDDKAMSAADFAKARIRQYFGFSGASVTRIGRVIIKTADNVDTQARWYREAANHYEQLSLKNPFIRKVFIPRIHSVTLGKLYMEFVHGQSAVLLVNQPMLNELVSILSAEGTMPGENDLHGYASYVEGRAQAIGLTTDIGARIRSCEPLRRRTFCHGDFSLSNIICTKDGYALIDPSPKAGMESWILDAGKLRASLRWLDRILAKHPHPKGLVEGLDEYIAAYERTGVVPHGCLDAIKLAEESHLIRVWYYAKKLSKTRQEKELSNYYVRHYATHR